MNTARLRLRRDAELIRAQHAATLYRPPPSEPVIDPALIEQARRRIIQEDRDHGQMQLPLTATPKVGATPNDRCMGSLSSCEPLIRRRSGRFQQER